MKLHFKRASKPEIELLRGLAREIWTTCYPGIISMEQIEYMLNLMYSTDTITKEITNGVIWEVLEYNNQPVGFIAVTISEKVAKLNKLYMKDDHHGKGLGQQALQRVVDIAREHHLSEVYLTVNKGNVNAIKAYERFGFERTDSVVSDIGNGYVMDDFIYTFRIK
jgi:Acetyltransferases, including N-acetylases of ribosomal proteins